MSMTKDTGYEGHKRRVLGDPEAKAAYEAARADIEKNQVDRHMLLPYLMPNLRMQWDSINPTTIRAAVEHIGSTARAVKLRRQDKPEAFPKPVPVLGAHNAAGSIYSRNELIAWAEAGHDIRKARNAKKLRARIERVCDEVQPASLRDVAAALAPAILNDWPAEALQGPLDTNALTVAHKRLRNMRDNAATNGFPPPLHVEADHTVANAVFSIREVANWLGRYNESGLRKPKRTKRPTIST